MNKILTLIKREYKESVYKKSFIIMTILMPLLMIGLSVVPALLMELKTEKTVKLHVIDQSGLIFKDLEKSLSDTLGNGQKRYRLTLIPSNPQNENTISSEEKRMIQKDKIGALIIIPAAVIDSGSVRFFSRNVANLDLNRRLRSAIGRILSRQRAEKLGLDPQLITRVTQPVKLKTIKISKSGKESERGFIEEYFGTFVFVLILYMTLILYGTSIMRSIVQEKSSRIIEALLSGANPFQLMAGKVIGQGAVGLTQYLLWAIFGIALVLYGGNFMPVSSKFFNFTPQIFIYFIVFYILGYFVFSVLYAAIGALSNTDQEAQQLSFPVVFLLIIPLMLIGFIVKNPDSGLAVILSLIPFFSPIIMFARINLTSPPFFEIFTAIALLVLTIFLLIWIVAKIYRVGILMYGKRPSLPEIIRWMRYK